MFFRWSRFLALKNYQDSQLARTIESKGCLDLSLREAKTLFSKCFQGLDFILSSRFNTWTGILYVPNEVAPSCVSISAHSKLALIHPGVWHSGSGDDDRLSPAPQGTVVSFIMIGMDL